MALVLHGGAGGWDELLIAGAAFAVMWLAVKLAGRKPADDEPDAVDGVAAGESQVTDVHHEETQEAKAHGAPEEHTRAGQPATTERP